LGVDDALSAALRRRDAAAVGAGSGTLSGPNTRPPSALSSRQQQQQQQQQQGRKGERGGSGSGLGALSNLSSPRQQQQQQEGVLPQMKFYAGLEEADDLAHHKSHHSHMPDVTVLDPDLADALLDGSLSLDDGSMLSRTGSPVVGRTPAPGGGDDGGLL
jgi:hypothetical protein